MRAKKRNYNRDKDVTVKEAKDKRRSTKRGKRALRKAEKR